MFGNWFWQPIPLSNPIIHLLNVCSMASIPMPISHWYHHFDNLQLLSNDFYSSIEKMVKDKEIPKVSLSRINLSEGGLFSSSREYLRIKRNEYIFDICAAPFGKQFFISWWLGETSGLVADILSRIPYIGAFLAARAKRKTYYMVDTETMFRESIHSIISDVLNAAAEDKGLRALSEAELAIPATLPTF